MYGDQASGGGFHLVNLYSNSNATYLFHLRSVHDFIDVRPAAIGSSCDYAIGPFLLVKIARALTN
jgi:hypothetical protein